MHTNDDDKRFLSVALVHLAPGVGIDCDKADITSDKILSLKYQYLFQCSTVAKRQELLYLGAVRPVREAFDLFVAGDFWFFVSNSYWSLNNAAFTAPRTEDSFAQQSYGERFQDMGICSGCKPFRSRFLRMDVRSACNKF